MGPARAARHRAAGSRRRSRWRWRADAAAARRRRRPPRGTASRPSDRARSSIHVSAGNPFRRWPVAHFVELAAALAARDPRRRIIVTSGPSEARRGRTRDRRRAVAARRRAARQRVCRAASSRSPSCARCSIAPRSTSAATAVRCTSRRRATVPIVGALRTDAARALGAVARSAHVDHRIGRRGRSAVPAVRSARLRARRLPVPDLDHAGAGRRGGRTRAGAGGVRVQANLGPAEAGPHEDLSGPPSGGPVKMTA